MSDDAPAWPDDDEDPFAMPEEKAELNDKEQAEAQEKETVEQHDIVEAPEEITPNTEPWTLPVRVSPLLSMSGEEVQEFPLNESTDGKKNTSLILSDNLIRVIEVTYDEDGQRRLNVKAALKNELTGFSHNYNELMHKHQWVWVSSFFAGLITIFVPYLAFLGQLLIAIGLGGWTYMHLEVHSLELSTSGSKHKVLFTGYGSNRPRFRASMALIGPTIAKYMDTGNFDTESITSLHESLALPIESKADATVPPIVMVDEQHPHSLEQSLTPGQQQMLPPPAPAESIEPESSATAPPPPSSPPESMPTIVQPPPPQESITPPPPSKPPESMPTIAPTPPPQESITTAPPPPKNIPSPLPVPPPPISPALPPATLPPPLPPAGLLPPLIPMDAGELPLDAPLPEAPEIAVTAAPVEESLSADEKNELLEELQ